MRKYIIWIVALGALAFDVGGFDLLGQFVHAILYSFHSMCVIIMPFLDLEQTLLCELITMLVVQVLCFAGFFVSRKAESKIGEIVSGIVDAIALVALFKGVG